MFEDSGLPDWFVKEEDMHMKLRPEVDPALVDKYRQVILAIISYGSGSFKTRSKSWFRNADPDHYDVDLVMDPQIRDGGGGDTKSVFWVYIFVIAVALNLFGACW